MKFVTDAALMRECDRRATTERLLPPTVLMERAAVATADIICSRYPAGDLLILCGTGNNGGDGAATARILNERGRCVRVIITGDEISATPEAQLQLAAAYRAGVEICALSQVKAEIEKIIENAGIVVDAIFGTGLSRPVTGACAGVIELVNRRGTRGVIALDIPSGISADTGQICGAAVEAELTVCYSYYKIGQLLFPGARCVGERVLADAGIHTLDSADITAPELCDLKLLPHRPKDSNKGDFGRVLCICGSEGMSGAAYLACAAAYRTGAGLVECMTADENRVIMQTLLPEAIFISSSVTRERLAGYIRRASSIVIGPGLGISEKSRELVETVLEEAEKTVILDADALNCIAEYKLALKSRAALIVTPHVMEMKRLCGADIDVIKADPIGCARNYAERRGLICVLKDARSVISDGKRVCINTSGCNGMSTGGSGDVLSGIIASLAAQGSAPFTAAWLGAYIHGLAGESAAEACGGRAMLARDIIDALGGVPDLAETV